MIENIPDSLSFFYQQIKMIATKVIVTPRHRNILIPDSVSGYVCMYTLIKYFNYVILKNFNLKITYYFNHLFYFLYCLHT